MSSYAVDGHLCYRLSQSQMLTLLSRYSAFAIRMQWHSIGSLNTRP